MAGPSRALFQNVTKQAAIRRLTLSSAPSRLIGLGFICGLASRATVAIHFSHRHSRQMTMYTFPALRRVPVGF